MKIVKIPAREGVFPWKALSIQLRTASFLMFLELSAIVVELCLRWPCLAVYTL